MTQELIKSKIDRYISSMPSLPVSAGKVLELCNKTFVNASDLSQVISLDPVLTGKLLQLINSAYYGLRTQITSLVKAITMLGINTVKNLTLSTAILSTLPQNKGKSGFNMEDFWRHCLCVGVTTKFLAIKQRIDSRYHQEYFTAGLLHDIGKITLNAILPEDYINAISSAERDQISLFEAENNNLGINHCSAGEMIGNAWKLDSPVYDVISRHHGISGYRGENLHILCNISIANYFSEVYGVGFAGNTRPIMPDQLIWKTAKLNENVLEELKDKVFLEIDRAKVFLNI